VHLSPQRQRYHNFQYFGHYVSVKSKGLAAHIVKFKTDPDQPWIRIRRNDADPTGSDTVLDALYMVQAVENKVREGAEP
jgi:hypothetical protein